MYSIQERVDTVMISGNDLVQASMSGPEHCAIIISYSGETTHIIHLMKKLKVNIHQLLRLLVSLKVHLLNYQM